MESMLFEVPCDLLDSAVEDFGLRTLEVVVGWPGTDQMLGKLLILEKWGLDEMSGWGRKLTAISMGATGDPQRVFS